MLGWHSFSYPALSMSLKLPPLNALKAFESAARNGSYVTAAEELHVSPAAVSQQVTKLENYYDKQLFTRFNNHILLTDAGTSIYSVLAPPLTELSQQSRRLLDGQARTRLVVSVLPSLAQAWLAPRFVLFCENNPGVSIQLRVEEDPIDFARDNIDLRICYGTRFYPDFQHKLLFKDGVAPLCSPAFLKLHNLDESSLSGLPDHLFLHTVWGSSYASNPGWADWFSATGINRNPSLAGGHQVEMSSSAIHFASLGIGVSLGQVELARPELEAGLLTRISDRALPLGQAYHAIFPHARAQFQSLKSLVDCL